MKKKLIGLLICLFGWAGIGLAQSSDAILARLLQDDKASVEALVLYPENIRNDILQACLYPELVVRIGEMQRLTSQQFSDLLSTETREDQQSLWELARFPALVTHISERGGLKEEDLKTFPEDIHNVARWANDAKRPTVIRMNELYAASESAFASLLRTYPDPAQRALRNLVTVPEVMSILSESLKMTVLVGDMYRRDPAWVIHKLDSLNLEVARRNAEDLQAWRDSLSANPQALREYEQSSEEFRKEQGAPVATEQEVTQYTTVYNTYNYGNTYNTGNYPRNYGYYHNPYPWWYGYPSWYDYPSWYPQPYWYHSGYYYGAGGVLIVYGMPSPYYTWWYFQHPWHHHHYPHLTHHFLCYHEGHRDSPGGFHREVNNWVAENETVFGKDWLKNDVNRPDRIKEFGQFEVSYHNSLVTQPSKTPSEQVYFETHSKEYPNLNASVNASPRPIAPKPTVSRPNETWPVKPNTDSRPTTNPKPNTDSRPTTNPNNDSRPTTNPNNDSRPTVNPKPNNDSRPTTNPKPNTDSKPTYTPTPKVERPPQNFEAPRSNPAPSYHNDTWQRADPKPTYSPKPQVAPRPQVSPKPNFSNPSPSPKGGIKGSR
ncbi:MAG: hypothetical protein IPN95_27250 [Bacteroidetes bacterium]|nr:hypothetical protein [Bacteroidota bacterium]